METPKPAPKRIRRKLQRAHKRLMRVYREISALQTTLASLRDQGNVEEDDWAYDLEYAVEKLSNAHLSIYYATRQFEDGRCEFSDVWRIEKNGNTERH